MNAQDVNFTQFYADKINLNPALTGSAPCKRMFVSYRNQWPSLGNTFVTYTASYDQAVDFINGGLGVRVMYDQQGQGNFSSFEFDGVYSYHLKINKEIAAMFGLELSFLNFNQTGSSLIFPNQLNETGGLGPNTETSLNPPVLNFDMASGFAIYGRNFYVGGAVHHLLMPYYVKDEEVKIRLPMKFTGHAGMKFVIDRSKRFGYETFSISPNVIVQMQGVEQKLNYGVYLQYNAIVLGAWARNTDWIKLNAISLMFGLDIDTWRLGYSYDISTTKLGFGSGGAHEITASYFFGCQRKPKYKGVGTITCPAF